MAAASPHDEIGDTHWYRPDFDLNLVREAESAGAQYLDNASIERVTFPGGRVSLEGARGGESVRIDASFLVDASGPRGFLSRALGLEAPAPRWLPPTQAVYTHFEHVSRWDSSIQSPYPPDDAAIHHIFPGGWIWVLRFNNGITSAGAALTHPSSWDSLLQRLPSVREQFAN